MRNLLAMLLASSAFIGTAAGQDDVQSLTCEDFLVLDVAAQEEVLSELESLGIGNDVSESGPDVSNSTTDAGSVRNGETAMDMAAAETDSTEEAIGGIDAANGTVDPNVNLDGVSVDSDFSSVIAACEGDTTLTVQAVLEAESD